MLPDALFWNQRKTVLARAAMLRLVAVYPEREYVDDGGLLSYGPSIAENFRHTADYVDRILKGAKPADLPVQQPTTFELIVSVKSAEGDWPRGAVFTAVARRRGDRMKRREFVTLDFAP